MIYLPNLSDTKDCLQRLLMAYNRLELRLQAIDGPRGAGQTSTPMKGGWVGVIRGEGPNGEDDYGADEPLYWVERVESGSDNSSDPAATLDTISIVDRFDQQLSPYDYITATNLAECIYKDGGGEVTATPGIAPLTQGRLVRVFTLGGAGVHHYFDSASETFIGYFAVTASSQDGTNKRWTYTMAEHHKSGAGYGGWTAKDDGRTITAYNTQEEDNGATGLFGNGVTSTNLTGTLAVKPAPTAKGVHRVYVVTNGDGDNEYWFTHVNAIDGGCS